SAAGMQASQLYQACSSRQSAFMDRWTSLSFDPNGRAPGQIPILLLQPDIKAIFSRRRLRIRVAETGRALACRRNSVSVAFVMNQIDPAVRSSSDGGESQYIPPLRLERVPLQILLSIGLVAKIEHDVVGRAVRVPFAHRVDERVARAVLRQDAGIGQMRRA